VKIHQRYTSKFAIFHENLCRLNSGLRSQLTKWPAGSAHSALSCEPNGQDPNPTWVIFLFFFKFPPEIWLVFTLRVRTENNGAVHFNAYP